MTSVIRLEPDLRLIRANNPSPLTGEGTNSYLLGDRELCVIDPGPEDATHLNALLQAIGATGELRAILVTHAHLDHSPLARRLNQATGAPVMAFGDARAGRSARMTRLAETGLVGGGEGVDDLFQPDHCLRDDEIVHLGEDRIRAIWTPGHFGNHLSFAWRGAVFSGDHVMGWSSTLVSPPDGDLAAYMQALDRLEVEQARVLYPGHGAPVLDPAHRIGELRAHRLQREAQILAALHQGPRSVAQLVAAIYRNIAPVLHRAAGRNVLAHLIDLQGRGVVVATPELGADATFGLAEES
ncbi:MAG: MBL fold metallo-hydrolase [Natronohydrobacter sp.]|nr:MBL fold metallo-hydrolase [Natronohydrobacter sp.]